MPIFSTCSMLMLLILPSLAAASRPAVSQLNAAVCEDDRRQQLPGWLQGRFGSSTGAAQQLARPVRRLRGGAAAETPAALSDLKSWWAKKSESIKEGAVKSKDPNREKAAALMKARGLDKCEKAVNLLREAVKKEPDDAETAMELADALNAVMRIKTNANALIIDGSLDTASNKKVWKTLGDEALPLAKQAYQAKPGDVKALAVYADSFMFSCSAKGIVKQALSGTAKEYDRHPHALPRCASARQSQPISARQPQPISARQSQQAPLGRTAIAAAASLLSVPPPGRAQVQAGRQRAAQVSKVGRRGRPRLPRRPVRLVALDCT